MFRGVRSLLTILAILATAGVMAGCAATWPVVKTETKSKDEMWAPAVEQGLSGEVKKLVQKGMALYGGGQFADGVESFKLASELDPDNVSVLANLGYGQSRAGNYLDAVTTFEEALDLEPNDKDLKSSYAYNLGMAGQIDKAEKIYREIAAENPRESNIYKNLAVAYSKNSRLPQAIMAYEKALEIEPDDWETLKTIGTICRDTKPPVVLPAISAFERLKSGAPEEKDKMEAAHSLGWLYVQTNTHCRAADMFAMVDEFTPLNKDDRSNYAYALDKCGKVPDAIEQYRMVFEADTTDTRVLCRLSFLYKDDKQYQKSVDIAQSGLAVNPGDACLLCAWGKALEKMNKYEEAIAKFEQALGDPYWGDYATRQIDREKKLIKIREMRKLQNKYDEG